MSVIKRINVGIIGVGVVGGGVINILKKSFKKLYNQNIEIIIKKVCVNNLHKKRDCDISDNTIITNNPQELINDPDISVIIETMGGVTKAKDIVFESIKKKKHVITANKALISKYLPEIEILLSENKVKFGYEAAVCGGIPIIHTLQKDLNMDNINEVSGIINGTTNYILSKMSESHDLQFNDVLTEAQELGYAEADPSADIDGNDIRSKISILTKLSYGVSCIENNIPMQGIRNITSDDFIYADLLNSTIKMIGISKLINNRLNIYVYPMLVKKTHPFANINGPKNVIEIKSDNLNSTILIGDGAGRYPTANSVVSDLISICNDECPRAFPQNNNIDINSDFNSCFYIRFVVVDQVGIIKTLGNIFENYDVSIDSIQQIPITDINSVPFVITTNNTSLEKIKFICSEIEKNEFCTKPAFFMPIF